MSGSISMPDPLTPEEITELRRLETEATPGKWSTDEDTCAVVTPDGRALVLMDDRDEPGEGLATMRLIAAARNALPRLLDEIERLRENLERYRKAVEGKWDRYDAEGNAVLPRGWQLVDGGRLDELESAEAEAAQTERQD